ncbi:MAG: hypothetical protein FWG65_04600 [Turicibacter sp.]|nr:hypothetical protein [Turicibacter sp.]
MKLKQVKNLVMGTIIAGMAIIGSQQLEASNEMPGWIGTSPTIAEALESRQQEQTPQASNAEQGMTIAQAIEMGIDLSQLTEQQRRAILTEDEFYNSLTDEEIFTRLPDTELGADLLRETLRARMPERANASMSRNDLIRHAAALNQWDREVVLKEMAFAQAR